MISSISGNDPTVHNTIEQTGDSHKVTKHVHMSVAQQLSVDTKEVSMTLSHRASAQHLKKQGCSIQEIAIKMNLDAETVTSYLA